MSKDLIVKNVPFNGVNMQAIQRTVDGLIFVVIKNITDGLGLDYSSQLRKLKSHSVLKKRVSQMTINTAGGNQEINCIELKYFTSWLLTVNPSKCRDEIKDNIEDFQERAADILSEAFLGKQITQPALPQSYEEALETLLINVKEKNKLSKQLEESKQQVQSLTPLALYASQQFSMIQKLPLSVFGKYLSDKVPGMGPNKISAFLIAEGLLFRNKKTQELSVYSDYLKIDSKHQFFNLKDTQYKKPVYSYKDNIKTHLGTKIVTSFQIEILKSGMEKVIELCHKKGLISNQQYIEISRDLPNWISTADYVPAQEYQQQLLLEANQ